MTASVVEVAGVGIDCLREGAGDPILLLHGMEGRRPAGALIERLSASHTVVAPSHPGWDDSPPDPRLTEVNDLAELYAELREELCPDAPVVGLSIGAWIAAQMCSTVARDVPALVLVAPIGIKVGDRERRDYLDMYLEDHDVVLAGAYGDRRSWPDYPSWDREQFLELARAQEAVARYAWEPYLHDPKLIHRLRRIVAPTLVVHGTRDGIVLNPDLQPQLAERIGANASIEVVDGAGHRIEEERPDDLARIIEGFLGSASDARAAVAKEE